MNLNDFIVLVPCVAALMVGFLIKYAIPVLPNRYIPVICGIIGLAVNLWINMAITPDIVVSGLVSGVAATGMFEMVRNLIGGKEDE